MIIINLSTKAIQKYKHRPFMSLLNEILILVQDRVNRYQTHLQNLRQRKDGYSYIAITKKKMIQDSLLYRKTFHKSATNHFTKNLLLSGLLNMFKEL